MKKLYFLVFAASVAGMLLMTACEKKKRTEEKQDITNADSLVVDIDTLTLIDMTDSIPCGFLSMDSITLINDNDKLKEFCPNAPALNFNNHSLIIISGETDSGIISVNGSFTTTDNVHYNLIIDVRQDMTYVTQGWKKYYLTTKIKTKENILLTINKGYAKCTFCNVEKPLTDLPWLQSLVQFYSTDTLHRSSISTCLYDSGKEGFLIADCIDCPDSGLDLMDCAGNDIGVLFGVTDYNYAKYNIDKNSIKLIYKNY